MCPSLWLSYCCLQACAYALSTTPARSLENVHNGIYPKQTELMTQAITFMLMDLALLSALVWALAQTTWKFRHEILRGFGSGPTGKWCVCAHATRL